MAQLSAVGRHEARPPSVTSPDLSEDKPEPTIRPRPIPSKGPARQAPPPRPTPGRALAGAGSGDGGRRYRLPVMELLGLSDTAELTISLPSTPAESLTIDLHATSLIVAPPVAAVSVPEVAPAEQTDERFEEWNPLPRIADLPPDPDSRPLIGRLWEATEGSIEIDAEWEPHEFEEHPRTGSIWWIAAGAALLLGVVASVWAITGSSGRDPEDLRSAYRDASTELRTSTGQVRELLGPITNLEADSGRLADAAAVLADLEDDARASRDLATEAPASGPFQSLDPDFEALRANLRTSAERAGQLEQRLADMLTYRMLLDRSFLVPPLPYAITPDNIPALGVEISLAVADTLEAVKQLPSDPAFSVHRQAAVGLAERLESWQVEYLEAVRNDDLETTSALIEEFELDVADLRGGLADPLGTVETWASQQLDYIRAALDRIDDLLAVS